MSKKLVLVDGSSYLYRAFHALPALTTSQGQPTGAIKGVVSMIRKLIKETQPDLMAVVFDAKGKTFRDDLFADYKANRPAMPVELREQVSLLHLVIQAMGLPLLCQEGVEADDVIGCLALQAQKQGMTVTISTGDKDLAQLVTDKISLVNTMTEIVLDQQGVMDKFGVSPEQIVDYLTLMGDSVDNIPGVPKVGPKTAVKWLSTFGSLDEIIKNADEIKGAVGENLRNVLEQLPLMRQLVTIKTDCELPVEPENLHITPQDNSALIQYFKTLEFKAWLDELLIGEPSEQSKIDFELILTEKQLALWKEKIKQAGCLAIDTETTDLNYMSAELVGLSFTLATGETAYLPVAHDYDSAPSQLSRDMVLNNLHELLESKDILKIGQNLKYDMSVLANYNIEMQGIAHDTMLESYILNSTATRHDLDSLALKYLGHKMISFTDVAGKGAKQLTFNQINLDQAAEYAAEDAHVTLKLHDILWKELQNQQQQRHVYESLEIPLVPVLSRVERQGVCIDIKQLEEQSETLGKQLEIMTEKAHEMAGEVFNLSSPKQLQALLYEKLKLPILKKTPKGQPSTAEGVLQELAYDYPLPKLILTYRSLSKLKSTYTDKLPQLVHPKTGRIHTSYHQAVTATGRLSSSDPNLQNIPIRTAEGRKIRHAFIAPKGYKLLAADYSQIELRIMAHLSQDKGLLDAFAHNKDIHQATAAEVFGVAIESVTDEQRRRAKAINFGLIYGMSAFGLAKQLSISRQDAKHYIDTYFNRYPGVLEYMENTRAKAKQHGYVETIMGRRLYLPEINSPNRMRQQASERTAINAPMQGTAADIIKKAMIDMDAWILNTDLDVAMIMQVHDELVFEVAEKSIDAVQAKVKYYMMNAANLAVPLVVTVGVGDNWEEAH